MYTQELPPHVYTSSIMSRTVIPYFGKRSVTPLLEEFKGVVHIELLEGLPPIRDTPHHNDLIPKASLLNLSHCWMHPKESKVLKEKIEELMPMGHNGESMNFVIRLSRTQKEVNFVEKSKNKYKTTIDKKR